MSSMSTRPGAPDGARPRQHDDLLARNLGAGPPERRWPSAAQRLPRIAAAMRGLGIPATPAHAGETSLVGRKRPPVLPLIGGDDVLRLPDFLLEFGNRLLRLAGPARLGRLAHREPRGFDVLEG